MMLYITIFVYTVYLIAVIKQDRAPASISDSFYIFNKRKKGLGHIFTLWMFLLMFLLAVQALNASNGRWFQFTGFFAVASLGFVGAAPYFKEQEKTLHRTAAILSSIFGMAWIILMGYFVISAIVLVISACIPLIFNKQYWLFWLENALFVSLFIILKLTGG